MQFCQSSIAQVDSIVPALPEFKDRHVTAAVGGFGVNVIINRIDAWPRDLDWAKVTPQHWYDNLHYGLETDGDAFGTNFLVTRCMDLCFSILLDIMDHHFGDLSLMCL